ncbi:MAG TPA: HIT domain-containing protein [Candidatus Babeliales bacterium]|nr:HIT domain-containing protein [Candidatus Babeliales bacterium]
MEKLYSPWRNSYVRGVHGEKKDGNENDCPFCAQYAAHNDAYYGILLRAKHHFVMMNAYPYSGGHLLITSNEHTPGIEEFSKESRAELMELASFASAVLKKELNAQGVNLGANLGKAAGAGIPAHFHFHVLPRWIGDTNFFPLIGETKQVGTDLKKIYEQLLPEFGAFLQKRV